jgi:uncharacterized protein YcfL
MRKYTAYIVIAAFLIGCAGVAIKNPTRFGLYSLKSEWLAVREFVITEHEMGRITIVDLMEFKKQDDKFSEIYNVTYTLYIYDNVVSDANIRTLRNMLLEARRKYRLGE